MPKQPKRAKAQAKEPTWYTATLTPHGSVNAQGVLVDANGLQIGRPVKEVWARSKEEVEAVLKEKGMTWQLIEIVKGRDPGPWKRDRERYAVELQTMLGRLHINAASPSEPQPMWVYGDPTYNEDATARTMWSKFMDESSHGLAVSDFPRFIIPDVDGSRPLPLPPADVRNMERWDRITSAVHEHLDFWKSRLLERIERLNKITIRSAEEAEQLKRSRANLKALKRFDKWSYQAFVGQLLPDEKPHPLDLDNPRLYWLSNGKLIPIGNLGPDQLRVDFWRRLQELRDGPGDKWADAVRDFLDHHYRNGGKTEPFRDLVKVTAQRLRDMVSKGASPRNTERWGLLADKLEDWLKEVAAKNPGVAHVQAESNRDAIVRDQSDEERFERAVGEILLNCPKCHADYHTTGLIPEYPCNECTPQLERVMRWQHERAYGPHAEAFIKEAQGISDPKRRVEQLKMIRAGIMKCALEIQSGATLSKDFARTLPLVQRIDLLIETDGLQGIWKSTTKPMESEAPKPLKDRFRSADQYRRFMDLLAEHRIVDAGGSFLSGHGQKSRLWGAYEGASENPSALFSIGTDAEIVATLNAAFPSLRLSASRPQDLRGTKGHTTMRSLFKVATLPQ